VRASAVRGGILPVVVATALVLGAGASTASAVVVHLSNGKTISYQPRAGKARMKPFDSFFTNLDYSGGPIMPSNTNYAVYWAPTGSPAYPAEYQSGVNKYFEDLAHDSGTSENVESVSAQYNDAPGQFASYDSHFGGALIDTDPYPSNGCTRAATCLTDAQLRAELVSYTNAHSLPKDLTHEYFLLTPPGIESCFEASGAECSAGTTNPVYCAYHGNIRLAGSAQIIYASDAFVTGNLDCDDGNHPNGPADGVLQGGLSHEHNESITDPEPNNAWADWSLEETGENGDKCRNVGGAKEFGTLLGEFNGAKYNQLINGDHYWYQQEWSNKGAECLQRLRFNGAEAPIGAFSATAVSGNEVHFDAAGSSAGAGFHYSWQFNDFEGHHEENTEETTALTINHTFPTPGVYRVALTVLAPDGTSIGAANDVVVNDVLPIAAFSVATASPTVGQPVAFDGSTSNDPDGSIVDYEWNFGDGSAGSGNAASHSYAGAGSYEVTLTVTDNLGASTSVTHSLGVGNPPPSGSGGAQAPSLGAPTPSATAAAVASSAIPSAHAAVNAKTGAVTLTTSVSDPGTFSWLATFQNGKFGAFASSSQCKRGSIGLAGRCRPAKIIFAKGSKAVAGSGKVSFTLKPSTSAAKALKNALRKGKGVPVSVTLSFQSSRGGSPVSHVQTLTVKLKS
jgi:PKD repeat protein